MRVTEAGSELDSEFDIEMIAGHLTVTMSSHSGSSGGRPARNSQYSDALRVILTRLADLDARITDALVVSSTALREYPDETDRRFGGPFPIRIAGQDIPELRTRLTEAMRSVARRPDLGPGGNNRRRVTLFLDVPGGVPLADLIAHVAVTTGPRPITGPRRATPGRGGGSGGAQRDVLLTTGPPTQRRSRAQGYVADAAYRRAVELHAMAEAVAHYEPDWTVEDTSAGNPYDLVITRGAERRYVEVKGTAGTGDQINLTRNEVDHARRHAGQVVLFVVHSIDVDRSDPAVPTASGGTIRIIDPFDLSAGQLQETAFTWALLRR